MKSEQTRIKEEKLPYELAEELLGYNSETGIITWKKDRAPDIKAGQKAGTLHCRGYICIGVNGKEYKAHRLAWLLYYGTWPSKGMDHGNGRKAENWILNLRDVDQDLNNQNTGIRKDNRTGAVGVSFDKQNGKWRAQIQARKKKVHLGFYVTFYAACYARHAANIKYNFHKNHGRQKD